MSSPDIPVDHALAAAADSLAVAANDLLNSPDMEAHVLVSLDQALGALAIAAWRYPDDRSIRACGRIVRRIRQGPPPDKSTIPLLEDVHAIVRSRYEVLEPTAWR